MAAFGTVQDKTTSLPSMVNSISDTTQPATNKTAASFIEGAGTLFEESVNAKKGYDLDQTKRKLQAGYDEENDKNGVSRAALEARLDQPVTGARTDSDEPGGNEPVLQTPAGATGTGNPLDANASMDLPGPAQAMLDRARKMERANAAQRMTPSDYNAKMEALVRSVRAEYPQYRDEIDAQMHTITGITPANALRASQLRDFNAAQRQAQSAASKIDAFLLSHSANLPEGWETMDKQALVVKVQNNIREQGDRDVALSKLALEDKQGGVSQQRALDKATDPAMSIVRQELTKIMNPQGLSVTELEQRHRNMSETDKQEGMRKLQAAVQQVPAKLDAWLASVPIGSTKSVAALMGPANVAALKTQALAPVQDYVKQWSDGNFGVLHADETANRLMVDSVQGKLLGNARYAASAAMKKDIGDAGLALVLAKPGKDGSSGVSELAQLASDTTRLEAGNPKFKPESGAYSGPSLGAQRLKQVLKEEHQKDPEITARAFKKQITDFTDSVTNEKGPIESRVALAKSIIRDASYFHDYFTPGSGQTMAYSLMTSPQMSEAMMKLSASNPDIKAQWGKYMEDNFMYVTRLGQGSLQNLTTDKNVKVVQDPKTGLFTVDHSDSSPYKRAVEKGAIDEGARNLKVYQMKADDLNLAYSNLAHWYKLNGQDAGQKLIQMSHALNIDVNAPKDDFWGKVVSSVKNNMTPELWKGLSGSLPESIIAAEAENPTIGHKPK